VLIVLLLTILGYSPGVSRRRELTPLDMVAPFYAIMFSLRTSDGQTPEHRLFTEAVHFGELD
jgi:hypothetical protein